MKFVIVLLSNSAFTITPSCVSTFSTPIFNHISLIILNVLFTSFFHYTSQRFTLHTILLYFYLCQLYYHAPTYHSFFFPILHSGYRIPLFSSFDISPLIMFFLSYFIYCTFVIPLSAFASLFLHYHTPRQQLYYSFLNYSPETKPVPGFCISWYLCIHILHTLQMLLLSTSSSIPSPLVLHFSGTYPVYCYIPIPLSIGTTPAFLLAVPFVYFLLLLFSFYFYIWAFPFTVPILPTSKTFISSFSYCLICSSSFFQFTITLLANKEDIGMSLEL